MKTMKKILALSVAFGMFQGITTFSAAEYQSPVDVLEALTGKSEEELIQRRIDEGITYGQMAVEYNVYPEFQEAMIDMHVDGNMGRRRDPSLAPEDCPTPLNQGEGTRQGMRSGMQSGMQGQGRRINQIPQE